MPARLLRLLLTSWLLLFAACGPDGVPDLPDETSVQAAAPSAPPGPALPPCPPPPSPAVVERPRGLVLPPRAVVTSVHEQGPVTTFEGFVPLLPVAVREFYESRSDLHLLTLEDEGFEAEALFGDGSYRTYVKAKILCGAGSSLLAVVGTGGASQLPSPGAAAGRQARAGQDPGPAPSKDAP